jgi:hypothetical protein
MQHGCNAVRFNVRRLSDLSITTNLAFREGSTTVHGGYVRKRRAALAETTGAKCEKAFLKI